MCGIAGGVFKHKISEAELKKMNSALQHRGPDAEGYYTNNNIGLAHKRLSIIDLDARANQPMRFQNLILVFNGEIYNHAEIKSELIGIGYNFDSKSDTEVLIKAFHAWKMDAIQRFRGMFSFAIYDDITNELFLIRDRLGVKPLYYYCDKKQLIFASEINAIKAVFKGSLHINTHGIYNYLRFGYFIGNNTIYNKVLKVRPGHFLKFANNNISEVAYWQAEKYMENKSIFRNIDEATDELEEIMIGSFKYRMISDVPVGVFFSGGIDSSLLVSILKKHHSDINTFTIGFDRSENNEACHAKKIAKYLGLNHTERILKSTDAEALLSNFYDIYDEPFHDTSGIPTSMVALLAKENGMKVVLSADGGDELFGGYPVYSKTSKIFDKLSHYPINIRKRASTFLNKTNLGWRQANIGHRIDKLAELLAGNGFQDVYETIITTISDYSAREFIDQDHNFVGVNQTIDYPNSLPEEQAMLWDIKHFLPDDLLLKVDRATMYHSLEGREPFLDHKLVEFALRLPLEYKMQNGSQKIILKHLLERYLPKTLFNRPKQGFSIPLFDWFGNYLDSGFGENFSGSSLSNSSLPLTAKKVQAEINRFHYFRKRGLEFNTLHAFKLASLKMWNDKHNL